jgi:putative addiction module component (TIGR02574 family)
MPAKTAKRIADEALKLPVEARAALAGTLLDSLDEEVDEDVEAAWSAEIARRVRELEDGSVKTVPWSEVRRSILRSRRETKRR